MATEIEKTSFVTHIKPAKIFSNLSVRDLWEYRELLYFMILRDVKVRYKQTAIGVLWAVLQPILTTVIFAVLFMSFARFESLRVPYPLLALAGVIIWVFVNSSVTAATNSLVGNSDLVTKIYFPRLIVPFSATLSGLIDLALGFVILIGLMFYYDFGFTAQSLLAPVFLLQAILLAVSVGTLASALNVRFRDVKFALPFLLQIWMFASPVFYPAEILTGKLKLLLSFNPLTGILEGFRSALFGTEFDWVVIGISAAITLLLFFVGLTVFKTMEDDFADLI